MMSSSLQGRRHGRRFTNSTSTGAATAKGLLLERIFLAPPSSKNTDMHQELNNHGFIKFFKRSNAGDSFLLRV